MKSLKLVSLFSGCGGLDLGFENAEHPKFKFKVVWANDIYPPACQTFSANFGVELYTNPKERANKPKMFIGDVSDVDFRAALGSKRIDVVIGGPPCQDFSVVRGRDKRKGVEVRRGRLYAHFIRALALLQPTAYVFENVKGLVSANNGLAYKTILEDFRKLSVRWPEMLAEYENFSEDYKNANGIKGYKPLFRNLVDFSRLGVPQKRERLIIVGLREDFWGIVKKWRGRLEKSLSGAKKADAVFPLTPLEVFEGETLENLKKDYCQIMRSYENEIKKPVSEKGRKYLKEVWPNCAFDIWRDYLFFCGLLRHKKKFSKETVIKEHRNTLKALGYYKAPLKCRSFPDSSSEILKEQKKIEERMRHIPPGENHEFVKGTKYAVTGLMSNIYRRLHPLQPAPTIIARGGGGTWGYHYSKERQRLTNRERARLQTFPDSFIFKGKPAEVRRQIGESVPPQGARTIAESLLKVLEEVFAQKKIEEVTGT